MLVTKLHIPSQRAKLIARPRLTAMLQTGLSRPLTLVTAPIGFGKTRLLSEWVHSEQLACAWLSLDAEDNDLSCFWHAVIAALATVQPALVRIEQALQASSRIPEIQSLLAALINDIDAAGRAQADHNGNAPSPLILILDDYHVIEEEQVHASLDFVLDHAPAHLHLIIASQVEPPLALARRRSRQEITEINTDDLRLTLEEATTFLNTTMALDLSADEIAVLENRTEGWIAGLHLAVLSLQGHPDRAAFIRSFAGDDRYVLDFLMDEVFNRQPEDVQHFLLNTAVLQRFCAPLCHAVVYADTASTHQISDSQRLLDTVVQGHLFVVSLDHEQQWYRYHHLFAAALRSRLQQTVPHDVLILHRRAAMWLTAQGLTVEALPHIVAVEDYPWAAQVLEQSGKTLLWDEGEPARLLHWLAELPPEIVHDRPMLCLLYAWGMYATGQTDAVEPYLLAAESRLRSLGDGLMPMAEIQAVMGEAIAVRALVAGLHNNVSQAIELSRWALDLIPEDAGYLRGLITAALAEAYYLSGNFVTAEQTFEQASTLCWGGENRPLAIICRTRIAETQGRRGQLHQAMATCQEVERLATEQEGWPFIAVGFTDIQRGNILREWNQLEAAEQYVRQGLERCQHTALPRVFIAGLIALARILHSRGSTDEALATFQQAIQTEQQHATSLTPKESSAAAYLAQFWLAQGIVDNATRIVQEHGWYVPEQLNVLQAVEYLTVARQLIAVGNTETALALLTRLQHSAEAIGYTACVLETLILQAVALQASDNTAAALQRLDEAVTLAAPQGYVRLFVDAGAPIASLLTQANQRGLLGDYIRQLLSSFPEGIAPPPPRSHTRVVRPDTPLSPREHEVLELVAAGLSNKDIARQLHLSPSTIKVHTRNIYTKLDVRNRLQATAKARELGIIGSR